MNGRLARKEEPKPNPVETVSAPKAVAVAAVDDRRDPVPDGGHRPPPQEKEQLSTDPEGVSWPDEAAEAAFLGEARERGEVVAPKPAPVDVEETESRALPNLDDLVNRIPANVRDTLEDLFRAKFVRVQRVPKRALKRQPGGS